MTGYAEFMEVVKSRRSVRTFKPDPVPQAMIDQIMAEHIRVKVLGDFRAL